MTGSIQFAAQSVRGGLLAVLTATMFFGIGTIGAAAQGVTAGGKRVALLTNTAVSPWIAAYNAGVIRTLGQQGVTVVNWTSPQDASLQAQQVDDAIAQKFDLIVVNSLNEVAIIPALERAKRAGVPVILSVQALPAGNESLYVSLVGHDPDLEGRIAGEELARAMGAAGGKVAIIQGNPAQTQTGQMLTGFKQGLAASPAATVVAVEGKSWRPDEAGAIARQLVLRFRSEGGLRAIYAMVDSQATQVIASLDALNAAKETIVVSSACDKSGLESIRAGRLIATVEQSPLNEVPVLSDTVVRVLKGEKVDKTIYVKMNLITKESVDKYVESCSY